MTDQLAEQSLERGVGQYRSELRSAVRGLWSGALDEIDAGAAFDTAIRRSFTQAYNDGAKDSGVLPSELTASERLKRQELIATEFGFVDRFLADIQRSSKANGGKLKPLFSRIEQWVTRYRQVYTDGQMTGKDDPKFKWVYDHGAEHCSSCLKLNDKVKRKSQWDNARLKPQSPQLECMKSAAPVTVCKCHFEHTQEPMSRGPLPRA